VMKRDKLIKQVKPLGDSYDYCDPPRHPLFFVLLVGGVGVEVSLVGPPHKGASHSLRAPLLVSELMKCGRSRSVVLFHSYLWYVMYVSCTPLHRS